MKALRSRQHSFGSSTLLAPPNSNRGLRSILLFTVPLRASENMTNVARTRLEDHLGTGKALIKSLPIPNLLGNILATTEHWGIVVAHEWAIWEGSVFQIERRGGTRALVQSSAELLKETGSDGALKWKKRDFRGRTFRTDEEINRLGMPSSQCQTSNIGLSANA
jgi:hypothetical protein